VVRNFVLAFLFGSSALSRYIISPVANAMPKGIRKVYRQNGDSIKAPNSIQWLIVESCTTWPAVLAVCRIECVKLARSVCLICR
jgi:hypothetical protein